ncbi:hypothetical protein [Vibrio parahaemolyticus]|uniref:hypothetical protein n=1 Tax=Vibrio parahaemolyticus TaxID=670 RepID=UPI002491E6AA|nr:hypothetical protein [Vibrio parahaemolyticus]
MDSLKITNFPIDDVCIGFRWEVSNEDQLARLIAIVVMGQALYAAHIIRELMPARPAFSTEELKKEATIKFTVQDTPQPIRSGYPREQRDGLIFEIISWIAAKQVAGKHSYLKDPHTSSTSQGLDGLMIELSDDGKEILKSTIFEDKCSINPRRTFTQSVIPGFIDRHKNTRNSELIAEATSLIKLSGVDDIAAMRMVQKVLDNNSRYYRAGFAVTSNFDTEEARKGLFKGYGKITGIRAEQRIASTFVVDGQLRDWFEMLAQKIITYISQLDGDLSNV